MWMAGRPSGRGDDYWPLREGYLKIVLIGPIMQAYVALLAARLVAGLILFGTVASERELLMVGVALSVFALVGWHVRWWLGHRQRTRARVR